jgi:peptidoglycan/LPS O-acetylase OafA/YrhL
MREQRTTRALDVAIAVLAIASGIVVVRDAASYDGTLVGFAVWGLYLVAALLLTGATLLVLRVLRSPRSRAVTAAILTVAMIALFPVSMEWHDDETVQGLLPSLQAAALAAGLQSMPTVKYTGGCCE